MLFPNYASPRRGASTRGSSARSTHCTEGGRLRRDYQLLRARVPLWRARMLGGRTNKWGRIHFRFGPDDSRARASTGSATDWPSATKSRSVLRSRPTRGLALHGARKAFETSRRHLPPTGAAMLRVLVKNERQLRLPAFGEKIGLTQPLKEGACHYWARWSRLRSDELFQSGRLIAPAQATGKLTLLTNAMVREGSHFGRTKKRPAFHIEQVKGERCKRCRVVVLEARRVESSRIIINSKTEVPQGLANSSRHGWNNTDTRA